MPGIKSWIVCWPLHISESGGHDTGWIWWRDAESRGHEFDFLAPNAYQYRDYVIRAFNADVPYDQFVTEHIAGDLLPQPRREPTAGFNESILGTGFWFLGEVVHSPVDTRQDEVDRFDNMVDVMTKTFLGLTVACGVVTIISLMRSPPRTITPCSASCGAAATVWRGSIR